VVARIDNTAADYFQLPNDLNALGLVLQAQKTIIYQEFFIAAMPIGTAVVP
jgi:hypothetical protein